MKARNKCVREGGASYSPIVEAKHLKIELPQKQSIYGGFLATRVALDVMGYLVELHGSKPTSGRLEQACSTSLSFSELSHSQIKGFLRSPRPDGRAKHRAPSVLAALFSVATRIHFFSYELDPA